jgi:hypothetical protein
LSGYENKPLAVALLVLTFVLLVWFCFLAGQDALNRLRGSSGDQGTESKPTTQLTADHGGVAIMGDSNTVIGTQHNYMQAPERKPRARVIYGTTGFFLQNDGRRLYGVNLTSLPIGTTALKWAEIGELPEGSRVPLAYSLWILNGNVRIIGELGMIMLQANQTYIAIRIVCQDEKRNWWDGDGVLVYDGSSGTWTTNGFDDMRPLLIGNDASGRPC